MHNKRKPHELKIELPRLPQPDESQSLERDGPVDDGRYSGIALSDADLAHLSAGNFVIESALFARVSFNTTTFKRLRFSDVRFESCDISNADWSKASLTRVEFIGCRMTGFRIN